MHHDAHSEDIDETLKVNRHIQMQTFYSHQKNERKRIGRP